MKRLLTILAGMVLAATLAACGSSGASDGTGSFTPMPTTEVGGSSGDMSASPSATTAP